MIGFISWMCVFPAERKTIQVDLDGIDDGPETFTMQDHFNFLVCTPLTFSMYSAFRVGVESMSMSLEIHTVKQTGDIVWKVLHQILGGLGISMSEPEDLELENLLCCFNILCLPGLY